ncbi:MAG: DUF5680 domain-containing protein [Patescibacteria group bacterium]
MVNKQNLCQFLVAAKKSTYAAGDAAKKIKEADNSTTLIFESGDWKYHDNYFGGEPYGGREVVFFQGRPVFMMVYYGFVDENVPDVNLVYGTLQGALTLIPEDKPFRGPKFFTNNGFKYENEFSGDIENFSGTEIIKNSAGEVVYQARYSGGLVDQRK